MIAPLIHRALLSVSNKTNIVPLAQALSALNIEIISTGGTAQLLRQHNISVTDVSDFTGFPEIMDGRVKTLHPKIYGGLLARQHIDDHTLQQHNIKPIQLVVINLYPFEKVTCDPHCDLETAIENIDIGGPTLLRAAAKNYHQVTVVVDICDYDPIVNEIRQQKGAISNETRFSLAKKAFEHVARYDATIANYFNASHKTETPFPNALTVQLPKKQTLRYGENPHQSAVLYEITPPVKNSITQAQQLQGKILSYNNLVDADTALECVKLFKEPACVIVKHTNPCGVALGQNTLDAYQRAFSADPTSAFGGIIAFNQSLTKETAQTIINNQFVEVIIAPTLSPEAQHIFDTKPNIRVLICEEFDLTKQQNTLQYDFKSINGGLLIQEHDKVNEDLIQFQIVTKRKPSSQELNDLMFAWKVVAFTKSNAIVLAKEGLTLGIGAGQMSRVLSVKIATLKAEEVGFNSKGAAMASDAFFPFSDAVQHAADLGITAIIQPGGSVKDNDIINTANHSKIAMIFTGIRHFRH